MDEGEDNSNESWMKDEEKESGGDDGWDKREKLRVD